MTTKTKLMLVAVVLVLVLAAAAFTAVYAVDGGAVAGFYLPDVAGDTCASACGTGFAGG